MAPFLRRRLAAAAFALALLGLLLGLRAGAARVVAGELRHDAQRQLAVLEAGRSPWSWPLRVPGDLVAGRAFGTARVGPGQDGLRIASGDGTPFELGLPLARPADAAHWPRLALDIDSDAPGNLVLIAAHASDAGCRTAPTVLPAGRRRLTLDLRRLSWRSEAGTPCRPPAVLDYLFRLRVQVPAGTAIHLRSATLDADGPIPRPAAGARDATLVLPTDLADARKALTEAAASPSWPAVPLVRLPSGLAVSSEDLLALRDRIRLLAPAALVVPAGVALTPSTATAWPSWLAWLACAAYLLALAIVATLPLRQGAGPWLDIIAVMAGPLWLIAGLHLGRPGAAPEVVAFAAALFYAWRSSRRPGNGPAWRWRARTWPAWLAPWLPLPAALGLLAVHGHALVRPLPGHALAYLGWAALQQWLMLAVVLRRLEATLPRAGAVLAVAALFAALHTPNGMLMQLCLLAEAWWAGCFVRGRALLPVALAHAACALLAEAGLAGGLLRSLEVSGRFFF